MIKTSITLILSIITLIATLLYPQYFPSAPLTTTPSLTVHQEECTEKMQTECAVDLQRTAKNCAKAFATEGTGIISDVKCLKDLKADKAKCWPCLCEEAKERGWHNIDC